MGIMDVMIERDIEGYWFNPDEWDIAIANELAKEEGIELDGNCWLILNFVRHYYGEHSIAAGFRHLISHLASIKKCSKTEAKKIIFNLFPYGYVKQVCKIAGMKRPRAWSTG